MTDWMYENVDGHIPRARYKCAVAVCGNDLYLFGGSSPTKKRGVRKYHEDFYKLTTILTNTGLRMQWHKLSPNGDEPPPRDGHCMWFHNNQVYIYGGSSKPESDVCLRGLYMYDIGLQTWQRLSTKGRAIRTLGHTMSRVGNMVFTFGGAARGNLSNSLCLLHHRGLEWTELNASGSYPVPRRDHVAAVAGEDILIHSGQGARGTWFNDFHCLNTTTLCWSYLKTECVPDVLYPHSLVAYHNVVHLFSRRKTGNQDRIIELHTLDRDSRTWKKGTPPSQLSRTVTFPIAVVIHGQLFTISCDKMGKLGDIWSLLLGRSSRKKYVQRQKMSSKPENEKRSKRPTMTRPATKSRTHVVVFRLDPESQPGYSDQPQRKVKRVRIQDDDD